MSNSDVTGQATIDSLVERFAARGERVAINAIDGDRRWSYRELGERTMAAAAGLRAAGLEKGDRVLMLAANRPEWIAGALAAMLAGGAVVPLDSAMAMDHLAHAVHDSGARWALTTTDQLGILREAAGEINLRAVLLDNGEGEGRSGRLLPWSALLEEGEPGALPTLGADDIAAHFYTSGTSGLPKGVPLTHRNLTSNVEALLAANFIGDDERACVPLPFFHVYPFVVGMLVPLAAGAAIILPAGVSGPQLAEALREGRATVLIGVPRLYEALLSAIQRRVERRGRLASAAFGGLLRLSGIGESLGLKLGHTLFVPVRRALAPDLRLLASGGAKLDEEVAEPLQRLGWEVLSGYGLTETSPIVSFNSPGAARSETAGRPLEGVAVRIAEPEGEAGEDAAGEDAAGEGGVGEVQVRGPNVFRGYHNLPDKTAEAFTEDGWFRTGDLGRLDEDGYLHLEGRLSSKIVLPDGKNVDPEGLEEHYAAHPLIREIAIVEDQGRLAALIVPDATAAQESGEGNLREAIGRALSEQGAGLARYLRLSDYATTGQNLPRTPLGKIRRGEIGEAYHAAKEGRLRPREAALSAEDERLLESPGAREVWEWLQERFPGRPLYLDANVAVDLGIDSLEWVSLTLDLQQVTGIQLTEAALARVDTVRDLLEQAAATHGEAGAVEPQALTPEQEGWVRPAEGAARLISHALYAVNRAIFSIVFPLHVQGVERLPDREPLVIAANHTSYLDPLALGAAMRRAVLKRTFWAGYDQITHRNALRRLFSRAAQVFPVNARTAPVSSLSYGKAVLERGNVLVWFPEGRRSSDGRLGRFTAGIGVMLDEVDARVVPVAIRGAYEAWPTDRLLPRPGGIEVIFGEPRSPAELVGGDADEDSGESRAIQVASGLRREVARLLGDSSSPPGEDGIAPPREKAGDS